MPRRGMTGQYGPWFAGYGNANPFLTGKETGCPRDVGERCGRVCIFESSAQRGAGSLTDSRPRGGKEEENLMAGFSRG